MTRRWLGGVFGNTVGSDTPASSTTGVFSMEQQYYIVQEGGWIPPVAEGGNQEIVFGNYFLQVFTGSKGPDLLLIEILILIFS